MGPAKDLVQIGGGRGAIGLRDGRQHVADILQMLLMLDLKRCQELLANVLQSRYFSTVLVSCCPSAFKLVAAFSSWLVLTAVWSAAWRISFRAWVTCSKPICC